MMAPDAIAFLLGMVVGGVIALVSVWVRLR
jgi:hypothetical protein